METKNKKFKRNSKTKKTQSYKNQKSLRINHKKIKKTQKKLKVKKKYPYFPHVGKLVPLNLSEEKELFYLNDEQYNP